MGNDALFRERGSLCIGVGGTKSGRTETMFGSAAATTCSNNNGDYGLLGRVVETVLSQVQEHAVCTLSVLEIVDEDNLKDLLLVGESKRLSIRHVDKRGAVVHGLSDVPLDSMTGLGVSRLD